MRLAKNIFPLTERGHQAIIPVTVPVTEESLKKANMIQSLP